MKKRERISPQLSRRVWRCTLFAISLCGVAAVPAAVMPSASDALAHQHAIANALALAAQVQGQVADYRQRNNAFPTSTAEANAPIVIATADVKSINVRGAGVIEVTLTASSGIDDGVIVLTPTIAKTADDGHVEWHCATASYTAIADMTGGQCEYTKLP